MKKIKIISDSTCDLSEELIKQNDITIIPLLVLFGEEEYKDGVTIKTRELYDKVKKVNYLPKTSAISPADFAKTFLEYTKKGYDIIYTGIGSTLSATFNSAKIAKSELNLDNVYLIDSLNLSSGSGLVVLKIAKLRDEGMDASSIKENIEKHVIPNVRSQFAIQTMEYLHRGGRCNSLTRFLGTMIKLKPIIKVVNGVLSVGKKPLGPMTKALDVMLKDAVSEKDKIDPDFFFVTHSLAYDSADYILPKVKEQFDFVKNIYCTEAGCVISSHCGEGTIGLLYILKDE